MWMTRLFRGTRSVLLLCLSFLVVHSLCPAAPPSPTPPELSDQAFLEQLEHRTFQFFWDQADPETGLLPDRYPTPSFASIAAVGFGLTGYTIGAERGYVTRAQAAERVLKTLRFLDKAPQGEAREGMTGYRGFYYHFLDMKTGKRFQQVELSTVDTALLLAGALNCQSYFSQSDPQEVEIRQIVDRMYRRVEWPWAMPRKHRIALGWSPEHGFQKWDYAGYCEGMIMLVLALGSPTHPVSAKVWPTFTHSYQWTPFQGQEYVGFGPLFAHQFSHAWIDFRGIRDPYMAAKGIDYAENTRRATYAQRAYAMQNAEGWKGYGPDIWGFSACDGPADLKLTLEGRQRTFRTYAARGVGKWGVLCLFDDGTITPDAAAGSLPFTPDISLPALQTMRKRFGDHLFSTYGFLNAFNETFPEGQPAFHGRSVPGLGWVDTDYLGLAQGLILLMVENYRSGLVWNQMKTHPSLLLGLQRAGFKGGWLDQAAPRGTGKLGPQGLAH